MKNRSRDPHHAPKGVADFAARRRQMILIINRRDMCVAIYSSRAAVHRRGITIPAPFRARQSCQFLETGSLHPPPAALRRFPCAPAARALQRSASPSKKEDGEGRLRIRKHAVLPAPFWLKYNRKNLPIRQYGEIFSADFISKIHWQNCFAPKKSKFCAELRRDGAGMLTHGKTAQRRSPCKICLLRRMFSYAESAKAVLFF